jgi:antitoxin (DNA-binding transcriptional repressor) of toxin-antitoxin stability system
MRVTTTELANDSQRVLDRVIQEGEVVEVQRQGRTVAEIRPKVGASREELLRILEHIHWTETESRELKRAMDAVSEVFGYAGRD